MQHEAAEDPLIRKIFTGFLNYVRIQKKFVANKKLHLCMWEYLVEENKEAMVYILGSP